MLENLKLMCVFAHPDDESLGTGATLAKYAAEGVEISLIVATRGERGWWGDAQAFPGLQALGQMREAELRAAAQALGVREVSLLDYIDGDLDQADATQAIAKVVAHVRRVQPQVVITFGPEGAYGHPDHIAISQITSAALVCAADPGYAVPGQPPGAARAHRVSKLYYMVDTRALIDLFESLAGEIVMVVDGVERRPVPWNDWAITTRIDGDAHWRTAWQAISCHQTQAPGFSAIEPLLEEQHQLLLGTQTYYRAYSLVNGGRAVERDLFEGLRAPVA